MLFEKEYSRAEVIGHDIKFNNILNRPIYFTAFQMHFSHYFTTLF